MKKISHGKSEELGKMLKDSVHQTCFAREFVRKSWGICCDTATEQTRSKAPMHSSSFYGHSSFPHMLLFGALT